ncbi:MAG: BamA/TamA family outer membrane protein, partial [Pirellulaceae bacterium]|nr:BamA/TamA family outer membrane protein [Pirellulaceae bacterium]
APLPPPQYGPAGGTPQYGGPVPAPQYGPAAGVPQPGAPVPAPQYGGLGPAPQYGPILPEPGVFGQPDYGPVLGAEQPPIGTPVPFDVYLREARTGRFMMGVGVNSDAGVTGQIVIDERNFDITRIPTSWSDIANGTAFRGAGQGFRIEAMPGNQVQRYLASFTEPYLFNTPVSLNLSGFLYDRGFFDWNEQRLGGRVSLGYRLTHDLSFAAALRMESVDIYQPRVLGVPELDAVLGQTELYSGRFTLTHDTRDVPFFPTEGHLFELSFEQAFGSFDYPRGELDYRKYFLLRERPDGSGRHTLAAGFQLGFSGTDTPLYENYFAGGFSTLRGFSFRGASPVTSGVIVGGQMRALGSLEYFFPITADDMVKGVVFCDYGTVEKQIEVDWNNFRVAPGFGLRIAVPALGPAPLALDFAFPVAHAESDDLQTFSFFIGVGRS